MSRIRVIPVLTLDNEKLVKTVRFRRPNYIGDPVNAVKIFNDKEVDELVLLDITATKEGREPNYSKIEEICSEAFMPFAYGGGIKTLKQIDQLFKLGIEKVIINSEIQNFALLNNAASKYGSQSIVGSIDIGKNIFGKYNAYIKSGTKKVNQPLKELIIKAQESGVGELILNSIQHDGTFIDYDLSILKEISSYTKVPIVMCGGANSIDSFKNAILNGASAVAAGSLFVYRGKSKGILINYPSQNQLSEIFRVVR